LSQLISANRQLESFNITESILKKNLIIKDWWQMEQIQMLTVANAPRPRLPILAGSAKPHHSEMKPAQLNEEGTHQE
jgi:hypothetical protein